MEKEEIKSVAKTLQDGTQVTVQGDTLLIPVPVQSVSKDYLIQQQGFISQQIQTLQLQLDKINELLSLI